MTGAPADTVRRSGFVGKTMPASDAKSERGGCWIDLLMLNRSRSG